MSTRTRHYSALTLGDIVMLYAIFFFATLFVRDVAAMIMPTSAPSQTIPIVWAAAEQMPNVPARLIIPSIGVDAPIQSVGLTAKGAMGIPTGDNRYHEVGWFSLGVTPGESGSAVMDGHLDTHNLLEPGVFSNLHKLKTGDLVQVVDVSGQLLQFRVTSSASVSKESDTAAIFGPSATAHLNLITCSGDWVQDAHQYDQRLVVFTELIK